MGLFSSIGSFFGGPLGGLVGSVGDSLLGRKDARDANSANVNQTRTLRQTAYQDTTSDLKAAGLNPMLAYQNGATGAQQQPIQNEGMQAATQSMNSAQASNIRADTANKEAMAEQIREQTELLRRQQGQTSASTANTEAQTLNLGELRQNLVKQGYNLTEVGNLTRAKIDLMKITEHLQAQQINESQAKEMLARVEAKLKDLQIKGAENLEAFEKTMGTEGGNVMRILQMIRSLR